jgi:hypothetical protein
MPIFQDDLGGGRGTPPLQRAITPHSTTPPNENVITRKVSEESIRTELCEGPVADSPEDERNIPARALESNFKLPIHGTSDRVELIERLKRGESPTWLPNRNVRHNYFDCSPPYILAYLLLCSWNHCSKITNKLLVNRLQMIQIPRHYYLLQKSQKELPRLI